MKKHCKFLVWIACHFTVWVDQKAPCVIKDTPSNFSSLIGWSSRLRDTTSQESGVSCLGHCGRHQWTPTGGSDNGPTPTARENQVTFHCESLHGFFMPRTVDTIVYRRHQRSPASGHDNLQTTIQQPGITWRQDLYKPQVTKAQWSTHENRAWPLFSCSPKREPYSVAARSCYYLCNKWVLVPIPAMS